MARGGCIVYLRVSTASQSTSSSFVRQLECCIAAANAMGLNVHAIFSDTCSGDSGMPNRTLAYLHAKHKGFPILVESMDRWSRMSPGCDPLTDVEVFLCSDVTPQSHTLRRIYQNRIAAIEVGK